MARRNRKECHKDTFTTVQLRSSLTFVSHNHWVSSKAHGMSSIWFLKLEMGPFWPGNEFRPDRLCSNSRWCGSPRARTRRGAISDAAGFPLVEPIRSLCRDGVRAADEIGRAHV